MRSATGTGCAAERCDEEARSGYCHTHHYHPACHNPPERFGACVMRFADGNYWCFGFEVAWGL